MRKNELSLQLGLLLVFFLLATQATAALQMQKSLCCTGAITAINLGVYQDPACTIPILRLDWGSVQPASINNQTIYIKNTGNTPERLSLTSGNWMPEEASQYLAISWNATGLVIQPLFIVATTIELKISANTGWVQNFNFTLIIIAVQDR